MNKSTFQGKYNNVSTGLYKTNTTKDIGSDDFRAQIDDIFANIPFTDDDSYTWASPLLSVSGTTSLTGTASPAITAYSSGQTFKIKVASTTTGAATLNLNSVGAKKIFLSPTVQVNTGEFIANKIYVVIYDSTLDSASGGFLVIAGHGYNESARVQLITSSASVVPNWDTDDVIDITAQAVGLTIANPTGTPGNAQQILFRIRDNNVAQTVAFGTGYDGDLPTITTVGEFLYFGIMYNSTTSKANVVAGSGGGGGGSTPITRTVTGADSIVQTDEDGLIIFNSATPFDFTIDQLLINTQVNFLNKGSATVTFINGAGVTISGVTTLPGSINATAVIIYDSVTIPTIATVGSSISDGSVTNAKLADMAAYTFKMRKTNSTGVPEDATASEARTILDVYTTSESIAVSEKNDLGGSL